MKNNDKFNTLSNVKIKVSRFSSLIYDSNFASLTKNGLCTFLKYFHFPTKVYSYAIINTNGNVMKIIIIESIGGYFQFSFL